MSTNILVLIHGMTTGTAAGNHQADYDSLWNGLRQQQPALQNAFAAQLRVEWGHRPPNVAPQDLREDQKIMDAENTIHAKVSYEEVKKDNSPQNHLLGSGSEIFSKLVTRRVTDPIKETVLLLGATDVFYYCAPDGEAAIRFAVYSQVLQGLEAYRGVADVRLHIIGHSLGVTVAHDFLFGLFAPDDALTGGVPGFLANTQATDADKERYAHWRGQAQLGQLRLGSFTTTAGQLPLTLMRKQTLVNRLAAGNTIDPTVLGIPVTGPVKWRMFYDVDDVLGFPARRLYDPMPTIEEFQVDTDGRPDLAHSKYWTNSTVLQKIAELLEGNLA